MGHSCSNSHNHHNHNHDHSHDVKARLGLAFVLNLTFAFIEMVGGWISNSVAIQSDALHDLGDSISLFLAWYFQRLSEKPTNSSFSYGYSRFRTLGAMIASVLLILGSLVLIGRSIARLLQPEEVQADLMVSLAILGVVINGYAAYKVSRGSSLSEKVISLHLLEDLLGWVIVFVAALGIKFFKIYWLDPALSVVLAGWIMFNAFNSLKEILHVMLQGSFAPDFEAGFRNNLLKLQGVKDIHHLHVWSLDGERHVVTVHVVVARDYTNDQAILLKKNLRDYVAGLGDYEITVELEYEGEDCLDPHHRL